MGDDFSTTSNRLHNSQSKLQPPRRRTPVAAAAANGHHHQSSFAGADSDLVCPKKSPSYVSLKDIIPSSPSILSPPAATASSFSFLNTSALAAAWSDQSGETSGYEISIRNLLVKHAAWAYLRPMSISSSSSDWWRWRLFSCEVLKRLVVSVRQWIVDAVDRAWSWLNDAFWFVLRR